MDAGVRGVRRGLVLDLRTNGKPDGREGRASAVKIQER
jgi:hypothetical protein